MNSFDNPSEPSSTESTNVREVSFSRFGLTFVPSLESSLDRWEVSIESLNQLPFFDAFSRFMEEFFNRNLIDRTISYVIWGGVAANLMLSLIGRSRIHYSFHDIELFLVRDDKIYQPDGLIYALLEELLSNDKFLLEVGGQSIVKIREGFSVQRFQKDRVILNDGDLYLNNVILIIDRTSEKIYVEAPAGTFQALLAGENALEMKDTSDLWCIDRIARRIYRNVSKSIRFEIVADLTLSVESQGQLESLIASYTKKLEDYFNDLNMSLEEKETTKEWIESADIASVESGMRWIYLVSLSETAKRLAGIGGVSSLDQIEFVKFLVGRDPGVNTLFDHPLIQLTRKGFIDPIWSSEFDIRLDVAKRCFADFARYQKPGAEKLREAYSLDSPAGVYTEYT